MLVLKFGGTSVATSQRVLTIVEIVKRLKKSKKRPVLVVSAVSGVTEMLLSLGKGPKSDIEASLSNLREAHQALIIDLFPEDETREEVLSFVNSSLERAGKIASKRVLTNEDFDSLVSFGEIISSYIVSRKLSEEGIASEQVISTTLIVTDENFMSAEFLPEQTQRQVKKVLSPLIEKGVVPVITGFIGATKGGRITTLGRGGSDYSASIIGYCLEAQEVQIWTDVDGIYTADPRFVSTARLLSQISFSEASEMASFGAKVLHPRTIRPALQKNIPVRVLNTFNINASGTLITSNGHSAKGLKAISFKRQTTLVNIYSSNMLLSRGFLARIFEVFAKNNISVDLVSVSEVSVSVTLDNSGNLKRAVRELSEFSSVSVSEDYGMISLIGEGITSMQSVLKDVSKLFSRNDILIRMVSLGASDINISLVLRKEDIVVAANLVHDKILLEQGLTREERRQKRA